MPHILVIDDCPLVAKTAETILTSEGFAVSTAENGSLGLAKWYAQRPDLVITDILMPEMDGVETILALRALDPHQPILAISGRSFDWRGNSLSWLDFVGRLGADEVLAKPFGKDELMCAVRKCLASGDATTLGTA